MPRTRDAEGYKFIVGDWVVVEDDYAQDGVFLKARTQAQILSRSKSAKYDGDPVYQVKVSGSGHFHPVLEEAFVDE